MSIYRGPNVNYPEQIHPESSEDPPPWRAEAARRKGAPFTAVAGFVCALASLWSAYFGKSIATAAIILGVLGIVLSGAGWRLARRSGRPAGLAVAGVLLGLAATVVAIVLLS